MKVVNHRQQIKVNRSFRGFDVWIFSTNSMYKNPIKKHPTIFTINVEIGKLILNKFTQRMLVIYLAQAPIPPPKNTARMFNIIQ